MKKCERQLLIDPLTTGNDYDNCHGVICSLSTK